MSAAAKKAKRPARPRGARKVGTRSSTNRGPFAHAADYRDALVALDAVLADLGQKRIPGFADHKLWRDAVGVSGGSAHGFLRAANEMIEDGERLRLVTRRLLVAEHGIKHARRWVGWKRPRSSRAAA